MFNHSRVHPATLACLSIQLHVHLSLLIIILWFHMLLFKAQVLPVICSKEKIQVIQWWKIVWVYQSINQSINQSDGFIQSNKPINSDYNCLQQLDNWSSVHPIKRQPITGPCSQGRITDYEPTELWNNTLGLIIIYNMGNMIMRPFHDETTGLCKLYHAQKFKFLWYNSRVSDTGHNMILVEANLFTKQLHTI